MHLFLAHFSEPSTYKNIRGAHYKIQYYTPTSHIIRERGIEGSEDEDLSHPATMYFMRFGFLGTQRQLPQNENFPFFVHTHTTPVSY